jgi:hypothetical protein
VTTETAEDYVLVKKTYPEAFVRKCITYNRGEEYTIFDPDSGRYVGPTTFSESAAWHHAAERLRKGEQ